MKSEVRSSPTHGTPARVSLAARILCVAKGFVPLAAPACGAELAQTLKRIKPSVVGIGNFRKTRSLLIQFVGTRIVVIDGRLVITNSHAIASPLGTAKKGNCHRANLHKRQTTAA